MSFVQSLDAMFARLKGTTPQSAESLRRRAVGGSAQRREAGKADAETSPQRKRSGVFSGGVNATEDDLATIRAFQGHVLTATEIPLDSGTREHCAYLDNGWFLVDRVENQNARVIGAYQAVLKAGYQVKRSVKVQLSDISTLYARHNRMHGEERSARNIKEVRGLTIQPFQQQLLTLFERAVKEQISDIHIFVLPDITEVKMRINGSLELVDEKPRGWGIQLTAAANEMCGAKGSNEYDPRNFPSGQISSHDIKLSAGLQALRMQQAPLPLDGVYMVCRLLLEGGRGETAQLPDLGYRSCHIRDINASRRKSEGVIFISGPTGSGKSTTLVITLKADMRDNPGANVITIEDPIEYIIKGAAQLTIGDAADPKEKEKLFDRAMGAVLRMDPNIVMVGEVRNYASASLAFKLANTGHRVYATVHASNAPAIVGRLREIGIEIYNLTDPSQVSGLIAQRLLRRLCPHCAIPVESATRAQLEREGMDAEMVKSARELHEASTQFAAHHKTPLKGIFLTNHDGCPHCRRGISGRSVVAETIRPNQMFCDLIRDGKNVEAIEYWRDHQNALRINEHAIQHMVSGIASPRDVLTETGDYMEFDIAKRAERVFGELMT